ncbi:hypothetical protein ACTXT7_015109 [Hymenolepis weldensis]
MVDMVNWRLTGALVRIFHNNRRFLPSDGSRFEEFRKFLADFRLWAIVAFSRPLFALSEIPIKTRKIYGLISEPERKEHTIRGCGDVGGMLIPEPT